MTTLHLITIGYAKQTLREGTREHTRMCTYAAAMGELHMIVFTRAREGYPDCTQVGNLYLYATNTRTKLGMLFKAYTLAKQIVQKDREKSWVISSQDPFETSLVGWAVARQKNAFHHVQIHGDVFSSYSTASSWLQRIRVVYGRFVVRRARSIRVVSKRIAQSLTKVGVASERISIIPIQADVQSFLKVGQNRQYDPQPPIKFLYVGRFAKEKNLPLLINAFASATKEHANATLDLMGSGPLQDEVVSLIAQHGLQKSVRLLPWSNKVAEVMATHDVLCLTSNHEGWGMVLLEAAATGMPVITTDVGCAGECVISDKNGQVVPVGDVAMYTKAIQTYVHNPTLIAQHGTAGHSLSKTIVVPENDYVTSLVDSYTSSL